MKKLLSIILTVLFLSANTTYAAVSELYYLKKIKTSAMNSTVESAIVNQKFTIIQKDPYYAVSAKNSQDRIAVILQQSGENMFYYYYADNNTKINKQILKVVKNSGIVCEQSFNANLLNIYGNLAQKLLSNQNLNTYTFDNNTYSTQTTKASTSQNSSTLTGYVGQIKKGTKIGAYLQNPIDTSSANEGDQVIAVLTADWTHQGSVVAPQGSLVYGSLKKARSAQYASRSGRVVIDFSKIVTPEGKTYNIKTEEVDFSVENEGKAGATFKKTATGAVVGALTGLLIGALSGRADGRSLGTVVAVSAGVGAGGGLISSVAEKGVDAEIPAFTEFEIVLDQPLSVTLTN